MLCHVDGVLPFRLALSLVIAHAHTLTITISFSFIADAFLELQPELKREMS
jgi:hypothetical protein